MSNEKKVFISHSSRDADIAHEIYKMLESNGIGVWIAPESIPAGESYSKAIMKGLKDCPIVVLVYSEYCNDSEHVLNEIDRAINFGSYLIPFMVEDTPMNDELDYYLCRTQQIKAYPNYKKALPELLSAIKAKLSEDISPIDIQTILKKAQNGDVDAQIHLAFCYEDGDGVEQSYTEAVKWYHKAAVQGDALAQCNLGYCFEYGKGVKQSYIEAVSWYCKAAKQGEPYAQCNLGWCYENGKGVEQSYTEAVSGIARRRSREMQEHS